MADQSLKCTGMTVMNQWSYGQIKCEPFSQLNKQMLHIKNISPTRTTPPILSAQYYKQNTQSEIVFFCTEEISCNVIFMNPKRYTHTHTVW